MDITFSYNETTDLLILESLFYEDSPPEQFVRAVDKWLVTNPPPNHPVKYIGYGYVALRLAILLQEKCNINELIIRDAAERRFTSGNMQIRILHRLYTSVYNRSFFYLDNELEPYIGDQQCLFRNVANKQYEDIHRVGEILNYKERARNLIYGTVGYISF